MINSDRAVVTLPLSPKKSHEYSRLVVPVIGEIISKCIYANYYIAVNLLDSFGDRSDAFTEYKSNLEKNNLNYDNLWIDKDNIDRMLNEVSKLIDMGYIYEKSIELMKCDCGIIELETKNLETCNPNNSIYEKRNNEYYCKKCGSKCNPKKDNVLVFDFHEIYVQPMLYPDFLNKDIKTFELNFYESYVVVSRNRKTGISITYNQKEFNIDIDFLWSTYLSLFKEKEKIVLCGNKELYQLFLVGVIDRILNPDSNTILIGVPIINNINSFNFEADCESDILLKKIAIALNTKWNIKSRNFDSSVMDYLKKLSCDDKKKLYEILTENIIDDEIFENQLKKVMIKQFNSQLLHQKLKERR